MLSYLIQILIIKPTHTKINQNQLDDGFLGSYENFNSLTLEMYFHDHLPNRLEGHFLGKWVRVVFFDLLYIFTFKEIKSKKLDY